MNPRQRRGLLLMFASVVVAIGVFVAISSYLSDVSSQLGPTVTVYRAKGDLKPYTTLSADNTESVQVPERWVSSSAKLTAKDITGRVIATGLTGGATVTSDVFVPQSDLNRDEREFAISVNAVTGLAGRIKPGDRVDVYAIFSDVPGLPKQARILVRSVRVVSVGGRQQVQAGSDQQQGVKDVVPVTLAVPTAQTLAMDYASSFASEVRLVGLPAGAAQDRKGEQPAYTAKDLGGTAVPEGKK